jgi:hypothetical protein
MKSFFWIVEVFSIVGLVSTLQAADLSGRVVLKGVPPPEKQIDLANPVLAAKYPQGLTTRHYQVASDGGLKNVLVYIAGDFSKMHFTAPTTAAVLEHSAGLFNPYVIGVQTGQSIEFKCPDGNMCTFMVLPQNNSSFVSGILPQVKVTHTFSKPELPVRVKCDVHPWNYAYVGVFAHPFFAVTDENGRFTISGIPEGKYTIAVLHPHAGKAEKSVELTGKGVTLDFEVTAK